MPCEINIWNNSWEVYFSHPPFLQQNQTKSPKKKWSLLNGTTVSSAPKRDCSIGFWRNNPAAREVAVDKDSHQGQRSEAQT